jgi:site-specific DNA-methyltransferase (adenine-specific)
MRIIDRSDLEIRERQRDESTITISSLSDLKASIIARGLLQPPFGWYDQSTDTYVLTGGRRRTAVIDILAKEGITFHCNGHNIPPGKIPFLDINTELNEVGIFEAEFDENFQRLDPSWQDRCKALAKLHELRLAANPTQTFNETGRELAAKGQITESPETARKLVNSAVRVAEHLSDPTIAKARNLNEAHALVLKREEEKLNAIIARRVAAETEGKPLIEIRHADLFNVLPKLEPHCVDLICTDPPYGIDANVGGFRARTIHHHNYDDSSDNARNILKFILVEGFRITKPRANIFIFTDIDHFDWLKRQAGAMGWVPFRTPLIWQKSESEGLAPWGSAGPRRTYDIIFYATKGERGLISSPTDIINVKRVPRHERTYAAEKPVELMRRLIEVSTLPGEFILDPCCGSGATLVAAKECNRVGLGIEIDEGAYNTAMSNLFRGQHANGTIA